MPDTKTHLVTINLMVRGENKTEIDASVHAQLDKTVDLIRGTRGVTLLDYERELL